jgi:two-component system NtrC family sensor kinase
VWANASQIQQTLLNLIINAEQALEGRPEPRRVTCRTHQDLEDVRLDIEDNGPGIPAATRDRIFDPFFTTKAEGAGTGLGLSICYGIVHEHGGRIWAQSSRSGGAAFCITLPRDPRATLPATAPPAAAAAAADPLAELSGLRILLAEDEESLRRAVSAFLARDGITVRAVADGAAALAALGEESYDVIISDVRMPGVGGREFIARLGRDRPELLTRLVFLTGDTLAPDTALLLREVGAPALAKPFEFGALERLIREIAARHPRPRGSV